MLLTVLEMINELTAVNVSLKMWADDTAKFYVDNVVVKNELLLAQGPACNATPISCPPDLFFSYVAQLPAGPHTFKWEVFQVGTGTTNNSNPFGLLYAGEYDTGWRWGR